MRMPHAPSPHELAALEAFLADPARPEGTLSLGELYGFLFAVTSAPDMVPMPEIFDFVFGDLDGVFETVDEADEVLGWIGGLYNQINAGVLSRSPKLPAGVAFRDEPMDNFDPECPVSKWARGFVAGYEWLEDAWEIALGTEMEDELLSVQFILSLFASRERADEYEQDRLPTDPPLEVAAGTAKRLFVEAMESYATMGRDIYEAFMELGDEPTDVADVADVGALVPGRNDPCPCGSGRKYKKCCGANVH